MATTFNDLMDGFGIVTVMNATICTLATGKSYDSGAALGYADFKLTDEVIDTLKIANLTQEGPTKTITGGQYANPLIKYGKTMTCEMQDALGRATTLERFMGAKVKRATADPKAVEKIMITDKFPGPFAILGDSFFIDRTSGDKVYVKIFIPQFLPDALFNLTQDAEGDATVFDLNGTIAVTNIGTEAEFDSVFYIIAAKDDTDFADIEKVTPPAQQ